jgi:hypothetical protein
LLMCCAMLFFPPDSGQNPLFYPKIGHKYLNLQTVLALLRVVVNSGGHKTTTQLKKRTLVLWWGG